MRTKRKTVTTNKTPKRNKKNPTEIPDSASKTPPKAGEAKKPGNSKKTNPSNGNLLSSRREKTLKKNESKKTKSTNPIVKKKGKATTQRTVRKSIERRKRKTDTLIKRESDKAADQEAANPEIKGKENPSAFDLNTKTGAPIVFSLEDVQQVIRSQSLETEKEAKKKLPRKPQKEAKPKKTPKPKLQKSDEPPRKHRHLGAASLTDILGYDPIQNSPNSTSNSESIPRKHQTYYRKLIKLRDHVKMGLDVHSQDTLKKSGKEKSSDPSSSSQHTTDGETDDFERDFVLSLVSNEHDVLMEIEAAINRIFDGSYGICEVTGKAINRERLNAVPFTRFSVEGQQEHEASNKRTLNRQNILLDSNADSSERSTFEEAD